MKNIEIISRKHENYIAPDFRAMEIAIEQNILLNGSNPELPKEIW